MAAIISYLRVSSKRQGQSNLGIEGQQADVANYVKQTGATVMATYREVESGKNNDRPELLKALAHAKRSQAVLCVAKMDRLARNAAFLLNLRDSGVNFVACDNVHASPLTIGILAVVAQDEAERISDRTKKALTAYKARGGKLGGTRPECRNLNQAARQKGARASGKARHKNAVAAYADLLPKMKSWREEGKTLQGIADTLNSEGHTSSRGKPWSNEQVYYVLNRS